MVVTEPRFRGTASDVRAPRGALAWVRVMLMVEPLSMKIADTRGVALAGDEALFFRVQPNTAIARLRVAGLTAKPVRSAMRAASSTLVASLLSANSPSRTERLATSC